VAPEGEPAPLAPPEPESPLGVVDPFGLGPATERLSPASLRAGRLALAIVSALLEPDERVEALVQGRYQHEAGVAVLTDRRVLLVNDHEWRPDVRTIPITPDLVVQGWKDDREASLVFVTEGQSVTIGMILDLPLAQEFAERVRARVAAAGA
jgi:hypothetical protein